MSHGWMNRHRQHFSFNKALLCVARPALCCPPCCHTQTQCAEEKPCSVWILILCTVMHLCRMYARYHTKSWVWKQNHMKARADKHNLHESHVSLQGVPFIHCLINCKPAIENILNFSFFATIILHSCRLQFTFFTPLSLCLRQTVPYGFLHYWEREM